MENRIRKLSELIKASNHVVVLTGAGMDTESNILILEVKMACGVI